MRRLLKPLAVVAAVLLGVGGAYLWYGGQALSGLAAKSTCSCLFVSRRPERECLERELEVQGIGWVPVQADPSAKVVTARAFWLRTARAAYHDGLGCTLE